MKNSIFFLLVLFSLKVSSQITFTSPAYHYKVMVPLGFTVTTKTGFDFCASGFNNSSIGVTVARLNDNPTPTDFNNEVSDAMLVNGLSNTLPNVQMSSRGLGTTSNGLNYAYYIVKAGYTDKVKITCYAFIRNYFMYTLITSSGDVDSATFRNDFRSVLNSFRFE